MKKDNDWLNDFDDGFIDHEQKNNKLKTLEPHSLNYEIDKDEISNSLNVDNTNEALKQQTIETHHGSYKNEIRSPLATNFNNSSSEALRSSYDPKRITKLIFAIVFIISLTPVLCIILMRIAISQIMNIDSSAFVEKQPDAEVVNDDYYIISNDSSNIVLPFEKFKVTFNLDLDKYEIESNVYSDYDYEWYYVKKIGDDWYNEVQIEKGDMMTLEYYLSEDDSYFVLTDTQERTINDHHVTEYLFTADGTSTMLITFEDEPIELIMIDALYSVVADEMISDLLASYTIESLN